MFNSKPHSVRVGLLAALALSSLVIAFPALAKPEGRGRHDRAGADQKERDTDQGRADRHTPLAPAPANQPQPGQQKQAAPPAHPLRAVPSLVGREARAPRATAPAPTWSPTWFRTRQPDSQPRDLRRPDQPAPYQLYRPPQRDNAPQPNQRQVSAQPISFSMPTRAQRPDNTTLAPTVPAPAWRQKPERGGGADRPLAPRDPQPQVGQPRSPARVGPQVPRAVFRGPEAEREVRAVPKDEHQRMQHRLQEQLRQRNRAAFRPERPRPDRDILGNPVPSDADLLLRDRISRINLSYTRVHRDFGPPAHHYVFVPRSRADYWDGYWDGYADGYWAGHHHHHHPPVVITFYYGYYWSDPYWFAFWYPGYYPSVYHYWGWCPAWIYPTRVYYVPVEYVYVPVTVYRYYPSAYAVDQIGAERAIADIRRAWFESDIDTLALHLTDRLDIRVYFDGEYAYTTSTEDYYAMTADALATTHTVAMDFNQPIWISSHEVFYTGRHVFYDPSGDKQTVYVSYRLRRLGGEWYIVAVGSSLEPIRHTYRDFRYS